MASRPAARAGTLHLVRGGWVVRAGGWVALRCGNKPWCLFCPALPCDAMLSSAHPALWTVIMLMWPTP